MGHRTEVKGLRRALAHFYDMKGEAAQFVDAHTESALRQTPSFWRSVPTLEGESRQVFHEYFLFGEVCLINDMLHGEGFHFQMVWSTEQGARSVLLPYLRSLYYQEALRNDGGVETPVIFARENIELRGQQAVETIHRATNGAPPDILGYAQRKEWLEEGWRWVRANCKPKGLEYKESLLAHGATRRPA